MNSTNKFSWEPAGPPDGLFHPELTVTELARERACIHPQRRYVTFLADGENDEYHLTYAELDRSAIAVGAWLQKQGLVKGDRAMIMLPNSLEFVRILYGCFYAGVIAVPQPQQLQAYLKTLLPAIESATPKLLIATTGIVEFVRDKCPADLKPVFANIRVVSAAEVLSGISGNFSPPLITRTDIAYLQYTSGSTGTPKGVMISHRNILANMEQARIFGNWEEGKGTSLWLPLFHDFGLAAGMLGAMVNGGFVILMTPAHFMVKPLRWLTSISRYRCAYSYAPPFGYDLCIRKISDAEKQELDLSSLVSSVYGAEPVHYESVRRFNSYFAACGLSETAIRPGFGMAETVIMFSESDRLRSICADRDVLERNGKLKLLDKTTEADRKKVLVNLGPAMHGHEIVIRGSGDVALPEGEVGEIMLSGPSVCEGYFRNPEATRKTFQQEIQGKKGLFLTTGDLGFLWQGDLYFAGRIKDIIIIRGKNHYPQDIEYAIPLGKEIRPECVLAFSDTSGSGNERLVVAMELEGILMRDQEMLYKYIIPSIDNRIVSELGKQMQIYPDIRIYLKPGTLTKTSSGKIKHAENRDRLLSSETNGLICRCPDQPEIPDNLENVEKTIKFLFFQSFGIQPDMEKNLGQSGLERSKIIRFLDQLEEIYNLPDGDLSDGIDDKITVAGLVSQVEEQLWLGSVPI